MSQAWTSRKTSAGTLTARESEPAVLAQKLASVRNAADFAMERYAVGDEEAFAEVYDAVAPRVFAYRRRQLRDPQRAEDLLQSTLLHMHRARGTFIPGSAVLPWAFAIARRLVIDEHRRSARDVLAGAEGVSNEAASPEGDSPGGAVEARELARRIQRELATLPETQRSAFELVRFDGLSHAEAAQVLGVTVASIKLRVHRVYLALRGLLSEDG